jgi:dihydroorotate dehydrogenase
MRYTPIEKAAEDYLIGLRKVYTHASYVAINISSPNTKNLRQLQGGDELDALLSQLKAEQEHLAKLHDKYVPLALKIAPDLDTDQIRQIAALLVRSPNRCRDRHQHHLCHAKGVERSTPWQRSRGTQR